MVHLSLQPLSAQSRPERPGDPSSHKGWEIKERTEGKDVWGKRQFLLELQPQEAMAAPDIEGQEENGQDQSLEVALAGSPIRVTTECRGSSSSRATEETWRITG